MIALTDVIGAVSGCVVAAWLDARTGDLVEQHAVAAPDFVAAALDAAAEVMRTRERPPRAVLLSPGHVHIIHRVAQRVLVVICERTANLGLAVATVRSFVDAIGAAA